jgi:hypothetical protein
MDRLSKELRMSVVETLGSPVVQLFLDYKYSGSGVLVEVDDVSGILTAEHVIFNRDRFKKAQVLSTIPRFYSVDSFGDPIIDDPATQASATHIRIDLLRWYPPAPHRKNYEGLQEGSCDKT